MNAPIRKASIEQRKVITVVIEYQDGTSTTNNFDTMAEATMFLSLKNEPVQTTE